MTRTSLAEPGTAIRGRIFSWRPSLAGFTIGALFLAGSLVPAMLPRPWQVQGMVSALALAVGYGVGSAGGTLWRRSLGDTRVPNWMGAASLGAGIALVIWALVVHAVWRDDIAVLMNANLSLLAYLPLVLLTALLLGLLLIQLGRGIQFALGSYRRHLSSVTTGWLAVLVTTLTTLVLVVLFFDLVVAGRLLPALEEAHRTSDRRFEPGVAPPVSSSLAGGPGSLINWKTMGSQGRAFVAQTPTPAELGSFSGNQPLEPIRIYVGLTTADHAETRATLALEEMERAGAFDRDLIVLIAPTGSGWIDPYAIGPIEYMHNGDTAAVAIQYSYLASWMVMMGNQDLAIEAARSLLTVVSDRLRRMPDEGRPRLLLYGESLGAFGWERQFSDLEDVVTSVDGALWVGPPRSGPLWQRLVADRDPGSPVWQPVYRSGETVRFGANGEALAAAGRRWDPPRLVYLQHASDPITWLTPATILDRPEWMAPPRGPDISEHMPYLPVVTFLQMAVDLAVGTSAPVGHGHKFGSAHAEAWALIAPPDAWSPTDTRRLLSIFDESPGSSRHSLTIRGAASALLCSAT